MSIVAIGIFNIPVFARITRGAANAVWAREYVLAARAAGKGAWRITLDHVLPNIASQLIVQATISFATAILAEAALSTWAWARSRRSRAGAACSTRRRRRCSRRRCWRSTRAWPSCSACWA
jgi:ABC-type antimicrobial peptide transport system permease subunit